MISTTTYRRLGRALAATVAVVALLVSVTAASAGTKYGPHDPWLRYAASITRANTPDPWFNYAVTLTGASKTATTSSRFITDTLAPGGGSTQSQGYRFTTDTLAPGGGRFHPVSASRSFSWPDAGIGAGVAVGSILCLAGGALLRARRRERLAV